MSQHRILRLRGLPWSADETDIREFLHAQDVKEVYICKRGELSTGEAYIEFSSSEEASSTQVACNREVLGGRYIEIFLSEAESMDEVKERLREQDSGWVVRLRGLPFKATQEDVVMFFKGIEVLRGAHGVTLIYGRDGRPLGEAYVELPDEESQTKALHLDRERMGARYIEVFKSTKADLNVRLQSARKNEGQRRQSWTGSSGLPMERHIGMQGLAPGMMVLPYGTVPSLGVPHSPSAALRLHGLPADSTVGEVAAFFSDFGVPPASVQIAPDQSQDGVMLGTSIAHVSFTSPELADIARQQSQQRLFKDRYLEVYPILGPSGISGLSGYQAQALPVSPSGMWSAPPVRYMYDDLSKLLAPKPGRPMYQPLSPAAQPALPLANPGVGYLGNPQLLPGQNPFGPQTPGSPGINRMQPTSPGGLSAMGQRGVFSPRPMPLPPGMAPASPLSMNQQAVGWSAQQQQQVFLLRQQQQQFLLQQQQNARMQPGPSWNLPGPRLTGPTQFGTQPRVPVQSHLQAFVPRPNEPQASIAVQQPDDTITRPLLPASSPENEATALPEETIRSNFPPFDRLQAVTRSRLSEPEGPASQHSSRPQASSSNLSERQSDTLAQNLSLTSLHLSDRALSGRSPAASTTNSAPSPSTGMRRAASNPFGSQNSPDVGF